METKLIAKHTYYFKLKSKYNIDLNTIEEFEVTFRTNVNVYKIIVVRSPLIMIVLMTWGYLYVYLII